MRRPGRSAWGGDTLEIASRDHRGQGAFGPGESFQQPVGEERPCPKLRDRDIYGANPGVEVAVTVTVADVGTGLAGGGVISTEDLVCLGGQDLR